MFPPYTDQFSTNLTNILSTMYMWTDTETARTNPSFKLDNILLGEMMILTRLYQDVVNFTLHRMEEGRITLILYAYHTTQYSIPTSVKQPTTTPTNCNRCCYSY